MRCRPIDYNLYCMKKQLIKSLDQNLPFMSEVLQSDIRLFVKEGEEISLFNHYHPAEDSLFVDLEKGKKLEKHKDIPVHKAFEHGKSVVGQYGLVINNKPIQEFAYPIIENGKTKAVIAVEKDIYITRFGIGQHWEILADVLIKSMKEKMLNASKFPKINPGEGGLITKRDEKGKELIFYVGALASSLLGELAENIKELEGREIKEVFAAYPKKDRGPKPELSIKKEEELSLKQRTINMRYITVSDDINIVLLKDVSEIKVRETLLTEIHHRVKNNLQTVVSLLRMQKRRNPELKTAFNEAINRIRSITLVHEFLSHSTNIELIDFGQLSANLIKELVASFGLEKLKLNYNCPEKVYLGTEKAINLALVINELLSNSLEHAGDKLSKIEINLIKEKDRLLISIEDNGKGFPKEFNYGSETGLGWEIIRNLAEDSLNATISIEAEKGAKVSLEVPV